MIVALSLSLAYPWTTAQIPVSSESIGLTEPNLTVWKINVGRPVIHLYSVEFSDVLIV